MIATNYTPTHPRDDAGIERKRRLARLLGRAKRRAIQFVEHLWTVQDVAQVEEPGERGGQTRARGGVALTFVLSPVRAYQTSGHLLVAVAHAFIIIDPTSGVDTSAHAICGFVLTSHCRCFCR